MLIIGEVLGIGGIHLPLYFLHHVSIKLKLKIKSTNLKFHCINQDGGVFNMTSLNRHILIAKYFSSEVFLEGCYNDFLSYITLL